MKPSILLAFAISALVCVFSTIPISAAVLPRTPTEDECRAYNTSVNATGTGSPHSSYTYPPDFSTDQAIEESFGHFCFSRYESSSTPGAPSPPATAGGACENAFLTFVPWHRGLDKDSECNILGDNFTGSNGDNFVRSVWKIILNILSILFSLIGYLALGFIVYGGYLYVLARGDPTRIAKGKQTVIRAVTGMIICILASLIVNTIVGIMTSAVGA